MPVPPPDAPTDALCPTCYRANHPEAAFCHACRTPLRAPPVVVQAAQPAAGTGAGAGVAGPTMIARVPPPKANTRDKPTGVLILAIAFWVMTPVTIIGAFVSGVAAPFLFEADRWVGGDAERYIRLMQGLPILLLAQTVMNILGGIGLWNLRPYGRGIALVSSGIWLAWGLFWARVAPTQLVALIIVPNVVVLIYLFVPAVSRRFRAIGSTSTRL